MLNQCHCHSHYQVSVVDLVFAFEKEVVCNFHGVWLDFLKEGKAMSSNCYKYFLSTLGCSYFGLMAIFLSLVGSFGNILLWFHTHNPLLNGSCLISSNLAILSHLYKMDSQMQTLSYIQGLVLRRVKKVFHRNSNNNSYDLTTGTPF